MNRETTDNLSPLESDHTHTLSVPGGGVSRHPVAGGFFPSRMHSRSASWSFTGSARPNASDFSTGLASINPIRSVIREFVPSLDPTRESSSSPPTRSNSQSSLVGGVGSRDDSPPRNLSSLGLVLSTPTVPPAPHNMINRDESRISLGSDNVRDQPFADAGTGNAHIHNGGVADQEGEANAEVSDWVRWVEQNAIFFIVLGIRFAWIHRSGKYRVFKLFTTHICISISPSLSPSLSFPPSLSLSPSLSSLSLSLPLSPPPLSLSLPPLSLSLPPPSLSLSL